jgi:hypothetical protein
MLENDRAAAQLAASQGGTHLHGVSLLTLQCVYPILPKNDALPLLILN